MRPTCQTTSTILAQAPLRAELRGVTPLCSHCHARLQGSFIFPNLRSAPTGCSRPSAPPPPRLLPVSVGLAPLGPHVGGARRTGPSVTGSFHRMQCPHGSPALSAGLEFHSSLRLNDVPATNGPRLASTFIRHRSPEPGTGLWEEWGPGGGPDGILLLLLPAGLGPMGAPLLPCFLSPMRDSR